MARAALALASGTAAARRAFLVARRKERRVTMFPAWARVGLGVAGLAALATYLQWPTPEREGVAGQPESARPAEPSELLLTQAPEEFVGVLVANEAVTLSAGVAGSLATFRVKVGDRVKRGDLLAKVDVGPQRRDLSIAEAQLAGARAEANRATLEHQLATSQYERQLKFADQLSAGELDEAKYKERLTAASTRTALAKVQEATAHVSQLRQVVALAEIRAPFDGTVAERFVERGAWLEISTPVIRVVGSDGLKVRFALPEDKAARTVRGSRVEVRIDGEDSSLEGAVSVVAPEVDLGARTVMCEATLNIPDTVAVRTYAGRVVGVRFPDARRAERN